MTHANRNFVVAYILLVGLPILGLLGILHVGHALNAPHTLTSASRTEADSSQLTITPEVPLREAKQNQSRGTQMPNLFTLVLQIAVVLIACRVTGALFRKIHQPRVVGEMFAGIMLGPSLFGWIFPAASAYLFPASSLGFLNALAQIGVVMFMFLVGLGTDAGLAVPVLVSAALQ